MGTRPPPRGVVLAAGLSTRMEGKSKLLAEIDGVPLVRLAAQSLLSGGVDGLTVVVGKNEPLIKEALRGLNASFVVNPSPESGMASSIVAGIREIEEKVEGVVLMLGDMPGLKGETVASLIHTYRQTAKTIVAPLFMGKRGHPAIISLPAHRGELLTLTGDEGARSVLKNNAAKVLEVEVDDPGVLLDIDTKAELLEYLGAKGENETPLCEALMIGTGSLVSLVGGGGKTTLMYSLLRELKKKGIACAGATTTKIGPPTVEDGAELVLGETFEELARNLKKPRSLAPVLGKSLMKGPKVVGIPPEWCDRLLGEKLVGTLVVEADGARRLPLKAPGPDEPVVPSGTTNFIAVAGLSALGKPFGEETVFRHELASSITGAKPGDPIDVEIVVKLLTAKGGLLKGCPPGATPAVFLNQADDEALKEKALKIATGVLAPSSPFQRVVAGRLNSLGKVEAIWRR